MTDDPLAWRTNEHWLPEKKKTNKDRRRALFYALSFQLMYVHDKLLMTTRSRHLDILIKKNV